jgi:hypothetical protein
VTLQSQSKKVFFLSVFISKIIIVLNFKLFTLVRFLFHQQKEYFENKGHILDMPEVYYMNSIKVHYMHISKYYNENPLIVHIC